ncbi:MAG: DUF935 family protein [Candidatus Latescibacterota bacterium]|jgi:SPP1 gp7 family putative phage head morphogenesis protein|nr:MAG: DUF935 family protein [Candidatus Latescibacterota bacterium]
MADKNKFTSLYTRDRSWQGFLKLTAQLPNPDKILESKGADVSLFRELAYDSQVNSCIVSREAGVMSCEYRIVPAKNNRGADRRAMDFITEQWNALNIERLYRDILEAVWMGYSPIETVLARDGERIVYGIIEGRPAENFIFDNQNRLRFLSENNPTDGDLVVTTGLNREVELVQYRASYRNPYGEGELARCFWPVHFKKGDLKFWIAFIEKFGTDPLIIRSQRSLSDTERGQLLDMLYEIQSSGAGVFEGEEKPETLGVDKKASSDMFIELVNWADASISKTLTGHSATADSTPGKLGNENMAETVRGDIQESDKRLISGTMNSLIRRLVDLNFQVGNYPVFEFFEEANVQTERAERDLKIYQMGYDLSEEYLQREYGFVKGDVLKRSVVPPVEKTASFAEGSQVGAEKKKPGKQDNLTLFQELEAEAERDAQEAEDLAEKGFEDYYGYFDGFVNGLKEAIESSSNFDEAAEKIVKTGRLHAIHGIDGTSPIVGVGNTTKDILRQAQNDSGASDFLARSLITMNALGRWQVTGYNTADFADPSAPLGAGFSGMMEYSGAKKFMTSKIAMSADDFALLSAEQKNYAFAVSGISSAETAQGILDRLSVALSEGQTYEEFKAGIDPAILAKNNLRLTYLQNLQTAYSVGRYEQMKKVADFLPYWGLFTVGDDRVRPGHAAMHGVIRRHDDVFWQTWYPPNGFRCRCFVRALTKSQVKALGFDPDNLGTGIPSYAERLDTLTEMGIVPGNIDPSKPLMPDEGFDHNPAEVKSDAWIQEKLKALKELRPESEPKRIPLETENWHAKGLKKFADSGYESEMKLGKYDANSGEKMLAEKLAVKSYFENALGKPVYLDPKEFVSHIEKDKNRLGLLDGLENILDDPDEIWMNIQFIAKEKKTVLSYEYMKMINGKQVEVIVHQYKGIPAVKTIYPNKSIDNDRMGYLIFKKGAMDKINKKSG